MFAIQQPESFSNRDGFRKRANSQLFHDAVPVRLYCSFGSPQRKGDLLVALASDGQIEDDPFPRRQTRHELAKLGRPAVVGQAGPVAAYGSLDHLEQGCAWGGLLKEVLGARLHGPHCLLDVAVTREEHDRQEGRCFGQAVLQIEPAQSRHLQVEQDATRLGHRQSRKKFGAGFIADEPVPGGFKQSTKRCAKGTVVVDDVDRGWLQGLHGCTSGDLNSPAALPSVTTVAEMHFLSIPTIVSEPERPMSIAVNA